MTADRDIERLLDAWLADGPMQVSDHAFDEAVGRVHRQRQRPAWRLLWKEPRMSAPLKAALGAAAIFVVVVAGFMAFGRSNQSSSVGAPAASPSPTPTPSANALLNAKTQVMHPFGPPDDRIAFSVPVPPGWSTFDDWALIGPKGTGAPGGSGIAFLIASSLFSDPCHRPNPLSEGGDEPVGPTVDDLASALVGHPGYVATSPTPVTLAGYSGQRLDLQLPEDLRSCDGDFFVFGNADGSLYAQGPGAIWHVWILDVDGTRVIALIDDYAGTSEHDRAQAQSIIDSITITP